MKRLTCVILAVMMLVSMFAVNVAALTPTADSTKLVVTKYEIYNHNEGDTPLIGNKNGLTGTQKDGEGLDDKYERLENVEFSIFKLADIKDVAGLGKSLTNDDILNIDKTYDAKARTIKFNGATIPVAGRQTTNDKGEATFTVSKDNYGLYFVKETAAPEYITATAQSFVVMLPRTNEARDGFLDATYVYPKNYTTLGAGILRKVDSSKNISLAGAKFALYKEVTDGDDIQVTEDHKGNQIGDASNELTTDANGYICVNNLPVGNYYFIETKAPTGYIPRDTHHKFSVVAGQSSEVRVENGEYIYDAEKVKLLKAENSSQPQINKYVTSIGNQEENVSFAEDAKWIIVADVPSDMGDTYDYYTITDTMESELVFKDGTVSVFTSTTEFTGEEIPFSPKTTGYTVSEVENNKFTVSFDTAELAGVKTVKIEFNTTLDQANTVMGENIYNNVKLNYATPAAKGEAEEDQPPYVWTDGYKFIKKSVNGDVLTGAQFQVEYENGDVVKGYEKIESDENGLFEVKGLEKGTYYLVETKAPRGYELLTSRFKFVVARGSYGVTKDAPEVIENVPIPDIPLTGGIGTTLFTIAGLALITAGVVLFVVSRKTKKSN